MYSGPHGLLFAYFFDLLRYDLISDDRYGLLHRLREKSKCNYRHLSGILYKVFVITNKSSSDAKFFALGF